MAPPCSFYAKPDAVALRAEYVGKSLEEIPTPAFVVNRKIVEDNCKRMLDRSRRLGASFRAHVKTHKTIEGTALQLGDYSTRVVVSTLMEAWSVVSLAKEGKVDDILYGLPIVFSRIPELIELQSHVKQVRLMIDHPSQLDVLVEYSKRNSVKSPWSFFIKVDMGTHRAGREAGSGALKELIEAALTPERRQYLSLYGFYCHAGHSYASKDVTEASKFLEKEIHSADAAAAIAKSIDPALRLVVSVGSTPTSHSTDELDRASLKLSADELELHAGNYPFCDLQQMSTHCISEDNVACTVLAEVASCYPGRGSEAPGEVLVNAGVIAMAREPGPHPGWGRVSTNGYKDWYAGRLSQEHGILVPVEGTRPEFPAVGSRLQIIPQHSCITANAFQWYYVTDGDDKVVDVWVAWRGW
jgi:D-serine deaminase-like pyridoxal phosphate-dependent protein